MPEATQLRSQIDLAQFAGFPVHFFDFSFLMEHVPAIASWNNEKLQVVIGGRADNMLARADIRLSCARGFYIIFSSSEETHAKGRANAISTDILKHFFGAEGLIPEGAQAFCRPSSLQDVASDLGLQLPSASVAPANRARSGNVASEAGDCTPSMSESVDPAPSLIAEMNTLFRKHFGAERDDAHKFHFAPLWDSANERIASFCCQPVGANAGRGGAAGERSAAEHCTHDIAALAISLKGVWQLLTRGDVALVTVPVHIETLSWSKQRTAYIHELAHIEPRLLGLLAFRIYGLDAGSSLSQLSQGVSVLRRHARRIFVHLPTISLDFSHAGFIGVTGLGVSAPTHGGRAGEGPLDALLAVTTRLKRICASQNAIPYLDNVCSAASVGLLKAQGVRLVGGPIFGPPTQMPGLVKTLPLQQIYSEARKRAAIAQLSA